MSDNKTEEKSHLENVIDDVLTALDQMDPRDAQYATVVDQLTKLHALTPKKEPWVKPEALIAVLGNLAGIVAILNHERAHVVTSKALGFVLKSRL
jgi:hypothetical protein